MLKFKLEKHLSFFRIPNLMFIIVVISSFVYVVDAIFLVQNGRFFLRSMLNFNKILILNGQYWRALTFIFLPFNGNIIMVVFEAYFLHFLWISLVVIVGEVRFTTFYITGIILNIIVGFLTGFADVRFLNMTLLFAFSSINPNRKMLLFYFIPLNTIWIGVINLVYFAFHIAVALIRQDYKVILAIVISIVNFIIFFGTNFFKDVFYNLKTLQENSKRMYRNGSYWDN